MHPLNKIPEIKDFKAQYKVLKREINRKRIKLKSLYEKYSFIQEIVNPNVGDFQLEDSVEKLFTDLGYKVQKPRTKADLDLFLIHKGNTIGIEVKNDKFVGENELFQGIKYGARHREAGKELHVLVVWNNSKTKQQFDANRISDAKIHKYGILTTEELLKGYLKVKEGKISMDLFNFFVFESGLVKFSNKRIKEGKERSV